MNGRVRLIDRAGFKKISSLGIEEQRVKVWLDLTQPREQWARLGHDYRVMANIVLDERKGVLRVPIAALFRQGSNWACFVRRGDRAELVLLELGKRNIEWAEVVKGLDDNDAVILYPSDRLVNGVAVTSRTIE